MTTATKAPSRAISCLFAPVDAASLGAFRTQEGRSATQIVGNVGRDENGNAIVGVVGDTEPTFRMGFANTFSAAGFRLYTLVDWLQGSSVVNLTPTASCIAFAIAGETLNVPLSPTPFAPKGPPRSPASTITFSIGGMSKKPGIL